MASEGVNTTLVVHAHHDLRIVAVLALAAIGEDKAHAALTDGRHGGDDAGLAVNCGFDIAGHFFRGGNVGAVGQPQIHKEDRRIG